MGVGWFHLTAAAKELSDSGRITLCEICSRKNRRPWLKAGSCSHPRCHGAPQRLSTGTTQGTHRTTARAVIELRRQHCETTRQAVTALTLYSGLKSRAFSLSRVFCEHFSITTQLAPVPRANQRKTCRQTDRIVEGHRCEQATQRNTCRRHAQHVR